MKRLEGGRGAGCACGGRGPLVVVLDDEPIPDRACARCGSATVMVLEVVTKEHWHVEQTRRVNPAA